MSIIKRASILPITTIILVMISVAVLPGCQSKNSVKTPNFSATDAQVLSSAYTEYANLKATSSPEQAR